MMKRTLEEWFSFYEKKTHERHINPTGYQTMFDEGKGYCQCQVNGRDLLIYECCGDGSFWRKFAFGFAKTHDLQRVMTICTRAIIPYIRGMGGRIENKKLRQGTHDGWEIVGTSPYGKFKCFPIWWNKDTKRNAYSVVCEVKK